MKICSKCKQEKDFICFHRASDKLDGFKSQCIECREISAKRYREENKEKISEKHKPYYQKNCEKIKENVKTYKKNNKEKIKERQREYFDKNPLALFKDRIRKSIRCSFYRRETSKNLRSEEILGCSMDDFFVYIASQFKEGMSLKNYGEWHLDHIFPLAIAETEEDVIFLCHYSNYQPLWAAENLSKGASI